MIEVIVNGFFVRAPWNLGAGGAVARDDGRELARVARPFGPGDLSSWTAAEIATLAVLLEKLRENRSGEDVLVRTGLTELANLVSGRLGRAPEDARPWIERLAEAARAFEAIRAVPSPGWVTHEAQDLALRTLLERARDSSAPKDGGCPNCRAGASKVS